MFGKERSLLGGLIEKLFEEGKWYCVNFQRLGGSGYEDFLLACGSSEAIYNFRTRSLEKLWNDPELQEGERFNDGKVDPLGRYWAGTLARDNSSKVIGGAATLFRREADGVVKPIMKDLSISNGLVWSKDAKTMCLSPLETIGQCLLDWGGWIFILKRIKHVGKSPDCKSSEQQTKHVTRGFPRSTPCSLRYYIDTATGEVDALDFDPATGTVANRRPVLKGFDQRRGMPDGKLGTGTTSSWFMWFTFKWPLGLLARSQLQKNLCGLSLCVLWKLRDCEEKKKTRAW